MITSQQNAHLVGFQAICKRISCLDKVNVQHTSAQNVYSPKSETTASSQSQENSLSKVLSEYRPDLRLLRPRRSSSCAIATHSLHSLSLEADRQSRRHRGGRGRTARADKNERARHRFRTRRETRRGENRRRRHRRHERHRG